MSKEIHPILGKPVIYDWVCLHCRYYHLEEKDSCEYCGWVRPKREEK